MDLKLADTDFRTPAHIDLLLGAEVFTSILLDGRWTGPQGTPFAINTCFGWVLFGKIQGNHVVDITNLTHEHEMLKNTAGLTRCYAVVLMLLMRKRTTTTHDEGKNIDWLRGNHIL